MDLAAQNSLLDDSDYPAFLESLGAFLKEVAPKIRNTGVAESLLQAERRIKTDVVKIRQTQRVLGHGR